MLHPNSRADLFFFLTRYTRRFLIGHGVGKKILAYSSCLFRVKIQMVQE